MTDTSAIFGGGQSLSYSATAATYYKPLGALGAGLHSNTTEAAAQVKWRGAGTFKNYYVELQTNTRTVSFSHVVRKNGADTACAITIPAATSGRIMSAGIATVADGDLICGSEVQPASGTGSHQVVHESLAYETSGQANQMHAGGDGSTSGFTLTNASTSYGPISGSGVASATETDVENLLPEGGTADHFQVQVASNSLTGSTTFTLRKNAASGNNTLTVPSATTGLVEDTAHSDTYSSGDRMNMMGVSTGTGTLALGAVAIRWTGSVANQSLSMHSGASVTTTLAIGVGLGGGAQYNAPGTNDVPAPIGGSFGGVAIWVKTNTTAAGNTLTSKVRGNAGTQSASIPSATTGGISDLAHNDQINRGDFACYTVGPTASGTITFNLAALFTSKATPFIPEQRPLRFQYRN